MLEARARARASSLKNAHGRRNRPLRLVRSFAVSRACIIDRVELIRDIGVLISKASTGAIARAVSNVSATVNNCYATNTANLYCIYVINNLNIVKHAFGSHTSRCNVAQHVGRVVFPILCFRSPSGKKVFRALFIYFFRNVPAARGDKSERRAASRLTLRYITYATARKSSSGTIIINPAHLTTRRENFVRRARRSNLASK